MAPNNRTNFSNILKRVYADNKIHRTFNRKRVLFNIIKERDQEVIEGEQFRYNFHTGGTSAGDFVVEGANIPENAAQSNRWGSFNMKTYLHAIKLSGQAMASTGSKKAAAISAIKLQASNAMQDSLDDFNIGFYTPSTGQLVKVQLASSTTVLKVESVRRLRVGDRIAVALISTGAAGTAIASTTIADIDARTKTITLANAMGATTGMTATDQDQYGNSGYGVFKSSQWSELYAGSQIGTFGMEDLIDEANPPLGNYAGLDRTAVGNDWLKGRVLDLGGAPISHESGHEAMDRVSTLGNGEVTDFITTPEIFREIISLHAGDKRYSGREKIGDGWFETAKLAGIRVVKDKHCTPRTIYGLDKKAIWVATQKRLGWEERDNSMWHRLEAQWAYQALLTCMRQIMVVPNCHVRIDNVGATEYL